jgi:putative proteasome-type protease
VTYCLSIITESGLVIAADSRTNAGVDYVSTYQKLFDFSRPQERVIVLCTSGNLSVTQGVLNLINQDLRYEDRVNLHNLPTLYDVAKYIGMKLREVQDEHRAYLQRDGIDHQCTLLLIYSQGNFIQATEETPFLQIGETKYGKPILDRIVNFQTSVEAATKCALLSIDSTMKSNISVGPPINLIAYYRDSFEIKHRLQLTRGDAYLVKVRHLWEKAIREAFDSMPSIDWS